MMKLIFVFFNTYTIINMYLALYMGYNITAVCLLAHKCTFLIFDWSEACNYSACALFNVK